jgi:alkylation response protein AidB-like acyl-CoA dehydrogenase
MDFSFSEEQEAVRDLAKQILEGQVTHERLKELEGGDERFDRKLWQELANAGLLGITLPEAVGGAGQSFLAAALLLEQVGRTVAMVPVLPTIVMGAMPIAEFGSDDQQQRYLPGVASGDIVLTAALTEFGTDPLHPTTTARRAGDGWSLDGVKEEVAAGLVADAMLVPASPRRRASHSSVRTRRAASPRRGSRCPASRSAPPTCSEHPTPGTRSSSGSSSARRQHCARPRLACAKRRCA